MPPLQHVLDAKRKSIVGLPDQKNVIIAAGEIRMMLERIDELEKAAQTAAQGQPKKAPPPSEK